MITYDPNFVCFVTVTLDKRARLNSVDSGDLDTSDLDDRPSSSMSVEKDPGDENEKVDVESPPTPPPPFLPPPPQIKSEVEDTQTSLVSPLMSAASVVTAAESRKSQQTPPPAIPPEPRPQEISMMSPAALRPCLPSPTYPTGLPGSLQPTGVPHSSLPYPYLYYSHMMSPYLLSRSPQLHPTPPLEKAAAAVRNMYGYPTYLGSPTGHHSSLPATPSRPAPIHPYSYALPPQVPANL